MTKIIKVCSEVLFFVYLVRIIYSYLRGKKKWFKYTAMVLEVSNTLMKLSTELFKT